MTRALDRGVIRALLWLMVAAGLCVAFLVVTAASYAMVSRFPDYGRGHGGDALLIRAPDGRCWRAHHASVEHNGGALAWRTDSGPRVRVAGADWIEVARGGGVGGQGLDWRGAAAVLGVDLSRCLPVAESAP